MNQTAKKQLRWLALSLALFFTLLAIVQYYYVQYQYQKSAKSQLAEWENDLIEQIDLQSAWDLSKYERASPLASRWIMIANTRDGGFLDIEESDQSSFIPGLIAVKPVQDDSIFRAPKSVLVAGDEMRIRGKKLQDGWLIAGIYSSDPKQKLDLPIVDRELHQALTRFGDSTADALKVKINQMESDLQWAILDTWGELLYQTGALPFEARSAIPLADGFKSYRVNGKDYFLLVKTLTGKKLGKVIIPQDTFYVSQAMKSLRNFNLAVAATSFFCFLIVSAWSIQKSESRRELLEATFAKYVSAAVLNKILKDPQKVHLGGEGRVVTLFFSDIEGFTSIAEKMAPDKLIRILNRYFEIMSEEILKTGGTIDKYIGDAIMAFWGAPIDDPEQTEHAAQASLAMLRQLAEFNKELAAEGVPEIKIRIGLHTGKAVVGNVGSHHRYDYTAIGDTVNAASRIEGLNKEYGTQIIISDSVRNFLSDKSQWKPLGSVSVRGRSESISIHTLA